ncbi:transcriptional regulator [Paenibacillus sp. 19GGS1-52]|uniref:ArpU family phage packaging/lysis transcriptional regulator n=1 Tax=Paenibacillus sp. 19GGS1-52 TaxID=2758563 RepID=UPI001EFBA466|nr:ArpU family phage packaging/lysis transcriptional regulator [Paenibacillus sp. 19GGS1-52]ULO05160.1 transcriptional regulator [Paenibacillus sp. 19GGS1-52]
MTAAINKLPSAVKRKLKSAVESELERYRLWKFVMFQEREATITASWSAAPKGFTGSVSDQTGNIAAYNVDEPEHRRQFCERVEQSVSRLPDIERSIITERYMQRTEVFDFVVFNQILDPPMSHVPYD